MDAALIDFERQHAFLDPANFNQKNYRIDIIGAGATGSYVAFQLAKWASKACIFGMLMS